MAKAKNDFILPGFCYHGTISSHIDSIRRGINLNVNAGRPDFGCGFYLACDIEQAVIWSRRKASLENKNRRREGLDLVEPVVIVTKVYSRGLEKLSGKIFDKPDVNWAEFVYNMRKGILSNHDYDFVFGPLADGTKIWPVLDDYEDGKILIDGLVRRIYPQKNQKQLSLHTIGILKYIQVVGLKGVGYNA